MWIQSSKLITIEEQTKKIVYKLNLTPDNANKQLN